MSSSVTSGPGVKVPYLTILAARLFVRERHVVVVEEGDHRRMPFEEPRYRDAMVPLADAIAKPTEHGGAPVARGTDPLGRVVLTVVQPALHRARTGGTHSLNPVQDVQTEAGIEKIARFSRLLAPVLDL